MYTALWRRLPGRTWVRILLVAILVALVVYALFTWVFPLIDQHMAVLERDVRIG